MAFDNALLDSVSSDPTSAVLRTYEWTVPTLSLGYFQSAAESAARFAHVPKVRRPTGGGAIWHEWELTYAVILPRSHPLGARASDLYRAVHSAIARMFLDIGIELARPDHENSIALASRKRGERPFLCFADRDPQDLTLNGYKLVGSAQRRKPNAILQHGSILLGRAAATPEFPGIVELTGRRLDPSWLATKFRSAIPRDLDLDACEDSPRQEESQQASALEGSMFASDSWLRRR